MPLVLQLPSDSKCISLQEFVEVIQENKYNFSHQEDMLDSAIYFNQLNNNKRFLLDYLCKGLKELTPFQQFNLYSSRASIIHENEDYLIRSVIWNPLSPAEKLIKNFKYDICHDHNFDFLTAGYYGPGYKTRCYEYNYRQTKGLLGEKVRMISQGTIILSEGDLMLYRSKTDIHIQLPPESMSVSINLIFKNKNMDIPQYQFNEETNTICRYIHLSNNEFIVRLAGALGDENAIDPLLSILEKNENVHIKSYAARSIVQIDQQLSGLIENRIENLNNDLLSDLYFKEKLNLGSSYDLVAGKQTS